MRVQNIIQDPCPICGKETTLAVIEPHPIHPERELHTYRCGVCGPVKTTSHRRCDGNLPRAARLEAPAAERAAYTSDHPM
jgi:uncharacterized Zn finger protein